ncbi:phosphotransferase, partial [Sphaerospermopsis aphanizomenoides]|uniref:phosphotransferase n=1 Tax=Sphaerospermopsis aphanizomenoides TaxID=459663 RepID=UPI001F1A47EB
FKKFAFKIMNYASLSNEHFQMLQYLVNTYLNGIIRTIVDKSPGHSGSFVYLIEVVLAEKRLLCIAKLTPADFALDDSLQNRVYGSCISSFNAVYKYLQQYQIPLPHLYASHTPSADIPFYCQLMEYLPGQEVNIAIKIISEEQQSTLQQFLGMHLGVIHNITRSYDGWVDLAIPHLLSWREAFFTTLHQNLDDACQHQAIAVQKTTILQAIAHYLAFWTDPSEFVLSHVDGVQGMIVLTSTGWQLTGVVDIEDHYFTDQRFVLAGYELQLETNNNAVLSSFWNAYQIQKAVDPTYWQLRPLFQLYYLLSWVSNKPLEQQQIIERLGQQILLRCQV